jgi:hypothetical protein
MYNAKIEAEIERQNRTGIYRNIPQTPVTAGDLGALEVQITGLRSLVHSMANRAHEAGQVDLRTTLRCFERRLNQEKRAMGDLTMHADLRTEDGK